jgi:two-component system invasion response regulator UvrY
METVWVLTVDDHPAFRTAARALIDATPGYEVAGEVETGEGAVAATERLRPQMVLMDVTLPDIDGYEATRRIVARRPAIVVVLVSANEDSLQGEAPALCGAVAVVRKQDLRPSLLQDIWSAHRPGRPGGVDAT